MKTLAKMLTHLCISLQKVTNVKMKRSSKKVNGLKYHKCYCGIDTKRMMFHLFIIFNCFFHNISKDIKSSRFFFVLTDQLIISID
jgi:hypothetical protein